MILLGRPSVTSHPDVTHPHSLVCVVHVTFRPDLVAHPHPLAHVARAALCCATSFAVAGRIMPALLASATPVHTRISCHVCAPSTYRGHYRGPWHRRAPHW
jgi:hypothetical protein